MIDDVAKFRNDKGRWRDGERLELTAEDISQRELNLYLPAGALIRGQKAQVEIAKAYAAKQGVRFAVRYVH